MKIKSIKSLGIQKTYNIEMSDPCHNYLLANGIVSANSHSIGYAHTSYRTAYLKCNYPAEYWSAVLSNEADQETLNKYLREAINSGIKVLPVDVNKSTMRYEVEDTNTIRRDLSSLKSVGAAAVTDILENRPYKNMVDFLYRTASKKVTSKVISTLILAGAFDHTFTEEKHNRKVYYDYFPDCRTKIKRYVLRHESIEGFVYDWSNPINQKKRKNKAFPDGTETVDTPVPKASKDSKDRWSNSEIVKFENEIYGMSVTYNVFDFYKNIEEKFQQMYGAQIMTLAESLDDYQAEDKVAMMIMVKGLLGQSPYKNQVKYPKHFVRRFIVEDRTEEGMLVVFERQFKDDQTAWDKGNMLIVECKVNINPQNGKKSLVLERLLKNCGKIDGRT